MAYTPTNWENKPSTATPIDASNLNKIEAGVADAHSQLDEKLESPISIDDVSGLQAGLDDKASTAQVNAKADASALTEHTGNAAIHVPGSGTTGHVLKKTASGASWQAETDTNTTYQTGTAEQLDAGTDTTGKLWSAKSIADYVAAKIAEANEP